MFKKKLVHRLRTFKQKFAHTLCTFMQKFVHTLCTFKAYLIFMEKRKILGAAFDNLIQILPAVEFQYFFGKILEICSLKFPVNTPTIPKC